MNQMTIFNVKRVACSELSLHSTVPISSTELYSFFQLIVLVFPAHSRIFLVHRQS